MLAQHIQENMAGPILSFVWTGVWGYRDNQPLSTAVT